MKHSPLSLKLRVLLQVCSPLSLSHILILTLALGIPCACCREDDSHDRRNIFVVDRTCRTKLAIEGLSINMERTKRLEYWEIEKVFYL